MEPNKEEHAEIELNLAEFSRELLEELIIASVEQDILISKVINNVLEYFIEQKGRQTEKVM